MTPQHRFLAGVIAVLLALTAGIIAFDWLTP